MERAFQTIVLSVLFMVAKAQNINGSYQPKADGQVKKQQVAYMPATKGLQDMVWDLRELELFGGSHMVKYTEVAGQDSVITGTERRTRYYYRQVGDSLLLCGYENNKIHVCYHLPELLLYTPLTYGDCHEGLFHGTSASGEKVFLRVFGSYRVEVDGTGILLLPTGDTLRHVSRVHIYKLSTGKHYPNVMTERELIELVDSIPFTGDSIREYMSDSRRLTETDIYRWYATGYRYPILETKAVGAKDKTARRVMAYYCAPDEQEAMSDEENEQIRDLLATFDQSGKGEENDSTDNNDGNGPPGSCVSQVTQCADVKVNGKIITVSYELAQDATITALVCDVSGIVYRKASQMEKAGGPYHLEVYCEGLRRGQYVLYLNVGGQILSFAVSL